MKEYSLTLEEAQKIYRLFELQAMFHEEQSFNPLFNEDRALYHMMDFERRPYHYFEEYPKLDDINSEEVEKELQREFAHDQTQLISEWASNKGRYISLLKKTIEFLQESARIQDKPKKVEIGVLEKGLQYKSVDSIKSLQVTEAIYKWYNCIFQVYESKHLKSKLLKNRLDIPIDNDQLIFGRKSILEKDNNPFYNKYLDLTEWDHVNLGAPESILDLSELYKDKKVPRESFTWYSLKDNEVYKFYPHKYLEYLIAETLKKLTNKSFSFKHNSTSDGFHVTGICHECKSIGYLRVADYQVEARYSYSFEELDFKFTEGPSYSLK